MFSYDFIDGSASYRLVSVVNNNVIHCGSYDNIDGLEAITCLRSGEKFYSIPDFMRHHYGLRSFNENYDFAIYDDEEEIWLPLMMWTKD